MYIKRIQLAKEACTHAGHCTRGRDEDDNNDDDGDEDDGNDDDNDDGLS